MARISAIPANNPGSPRATPARGSRAARRGSTPGFRAWPTSVAGSRACSPTGMQALNSISAGCGCADRGQRASGNTGIDVVGSWSLGSGPPEPNHAQKRSVTRQRQRSRGDSDGRFHVIDAGMASWTAFRRPPTKRSRSRWNR